MSISRRNFLKYAGGMAAVAGVPSFAFSLKSQAAITPNARKLVILTLAGGNDGMNTAIPMESERYATYLGYRTHATDPTKSIAIPFDNILPFGFDVNGTQIGLHPAMQSLMQFRDNLALFPTAHTGPWSNRSHFFQVDLIDAGLHTETHDHQDGKGWFGRYLEGKYTAQPDGVIAQDFSPGTGLFKGDTFVFGVANPANLDLGTSNAAISSAIWNDIQRIQDPAQMAGNARSYAEQQERLFDVVDRVRGAVNFNRMPMSAIPYATDNLAPNFKKAADMLASLPELEAIHIVHGGYDTHEAQGAVTGRQAGLLEIVANALAAFFADLAYMGMSHDVIVLVKSEFGRTMRQNQNGGTDHGQATCWMALGGSVIGGVYGVYPSLVDVPESNNALLPTVDYRDIVSEILGPRFLGAVYPESAFPSYAGPTVPLNFIV